MAQLAEFSNEQRRQLVDVQQIFRSHREASEDLAHRFKGSMAWRKRGAREYLYRKTNVNSTSLGVRSAETEEIFAAFSEGKARAKEQYKATQERLKKMAPVNRALGLGRVPRETAKVLRRLDKRGSLGDQLFLVGTNALYAYEVAAGGNVESGMLATDDMDLLLDSRKKIRLFSRELSRRSLMALLKGIDKSFTIRRGQQYSAANKTGFMVELICPQTGKPLTPTDPKTLSGKAGDLEAAEIEGLEWLLSIPRFEQICIGEDGLPVRIVTVDPRGFAAHKSWVSQRSDRTPVKRHRDGEQARLVKDLLEEYLTYLPLDDDAMSALPMALRKFLVA